MEDLWGAVVVLGVGISSMIWVRGTLREPGFDGGSAVRP